MSEHNLWQDQLRERGPPAVREVLWAAQGKQRRKGRTVKACKKDCYPPRDAKENVGDPCTLRGESAGCINLLLGQGYRDAAPRRRERGTKS